MWFRTPAFHLLALALALAGCSTSTTSSVPAVVVEPPAPRPTPEVVIEVHKSVLDEADDLLAQSAFEDAAYGYESVLAAEESSDVERQRALLQLAWVHLLEGSPLRDRSRARERLRALIAEFPDGPFADSARMLLEWQGRIAKLEQQLEQLKQIDFDRPPVAPPG